ncbi:type II toxin-antitoxin system PemK/MazF family toxin [Schinkia azotoformans]|uniref:type II toxin-antitoxin system PemK/MazF family toxin n=1 Tax=Schinkia azotoformans TaxID=1454 RepID=UPI002E1BA318|nr:type II toxin-antitoxin system PemK/MazF family toxin [Schinkia azotoformans]MED4354793.1 type II toxin-antitoxin system PemK/MazF family toxin [Schinkia azotoformans]
MLKKLKDGHSNIKEIEFNKELRKLRGKTDIESIKKIKKIKQKRSKHVSKEYPSSLQKGDIVNCEFGSSYCNELDKYHYVVILSNIVGSMYLVAPLTSVKPVGGEILFYDDLKLPSANPSITKSYVLFNQIRFVHFRRLENINSLKSGKRHMDITRVREILDKYNSIISE